MKNHYLYHFNHIPISINLPLIQEKQPYWPRQIITIIREKIKRNSTLLVIDKDVRALDVTMEEVFLVAEVESFKQLLHQ